MGDPSAVQVILRPEEFADELEHRLGRANGNIYHRSPGVEGLHDGQYMVRLKKKRFIIIDYSIIPNEADLQAAVLNPQVIVIPEGAGTQKCATAECTKVGVPVQLYDSNPGETQSLYMRAGLCFTCQRNLNEKRRTQRKRKSEILTEMTQANPTPYQQAAASAQKKYKVSSEVLDLSPEAIINGVVEDAKQSSEGYGYPEIDNDIQNSLLEAANAAQRLVATVSNNHTGTDATAVAFATAVAAAHGGQSEDASGTNAAAANGESSEDVLALYEKASLSLSKGLYLLTQWKTSWDNAVATAVAQETVNEAGLADPAAVASAAAVVAASEGQSMIPLILAAESKGQEKKEEGGEIFSV